MRPRFVVVVLLAVAAVVVGSVGPSSWFGASAGSTGNLSPKDRIEASPPPALFSTAQVAGVGRSAAAQRTEAARMVRRWTVGHGTARQDAAFATWLEQHFPAPPAGLSSRAGAQMAEVVRLAGTRTPAGVRAATWLEAFGKKDVWKLYAHDQGELLPSGPRSARKADEKSLLSLAKTVSDSLGARFGSSAPYVVRPSLRPDHRVVTGQQCPCSYPSRHAAASAASETLLGRLDPVRDGEYRAMEAQIDFSRVYMAGHFPDDITAGALLGDALGDYWLVTREGVAPGDLASAPRSAPSLA